MSDRISPSETSMSYLALFLLVKLTSYHKLREEIEKDLEDFREAVIVGPPESDIELKQELIATVDLFHDMLEKFSKPIH